MFLALCAFGIGPGDEVITCGNTFVATVGAIVSTGARPVLADVGDDELMNIDTIAPLLNDRTKAVIPVYLRGRPLDIDAIVQLCHSYSVVVIEDCAQAIGTTVNGQQVGTHADASVFYASPEDARRFGDGGIWSPVILRLPNTRVLRAITVWKHATNRSGLALIHDSIRCRRQHSMSKLSMWIGG